MLLQSKTFSLEWQAVCKQNKTKQEVVIKLTPYTKNRPLAPVIIRRTIKQEYLCVFQQFLSRKEATLRRTAIIRIFHSHYSNCMQGASTNECVQREEDYILITK